MIPSRQERIPSKDEEEEEVEEFNVTPLERGRKTAKRRQVSAGQFETLFPSPAVSSSSTKTVRSVSSLKRKLPEVYEKLVKDLPTVVDRLVPGVFQADTQDNEDHTFSGIMFNIEARKLLPIHFVEIQSVFVRGDLGRMSVYITKSSYEGKLGSPEQWTRVFGPRDMEPSRDLAELALDTPLRMAPGMRLGIYIHSESEGDRAIVYDDKHNHAVTYEDDVIRIHPGTAHLSHVPFYPMSSWGGRAFRDQREFVGRIKYGTKRLLYTPNVHYLFPKTFRKSVFTVLCCHQKSARFPARTLAVNKVATSLGDVPMSVMFMIFNYMAWDWFPAGRPSLAHSSAEADGLDDAFDDDEEENDDDLYDDGSSSPFKYKGHTGDIARLRYLFDNSKSNSSVEPLDEEEAEILRQASAGNLIVLMATPVLSANSPSPPAPTE